MVQAAAVSAVAGAVSGPGPTTLAVPQRKHPHSRFVHPGMFFSFHLSLFHTFDLRSLSILSVQMSLFSI